MPAEPDSQSRAMSSGLKKLQALLEDPVAMSALELDKNAKAAAQYSILRRLSKSLLQYIERDGALFYVGLIGHFSAGKTSSINSLLQTWKTEFERKTDFHPTDKTITLITREKNADSLLGVIREGHVPIRLQKIERAILDQIVLVDTPGTGDPEFFEEVARDFLPICDVILFLFSAASPLDASDVPLLKELHLRLPFIPLHFVVTRADELRVDSNQALTEANFDTTKANQFLDSAVSRVNALLAPQVYQSSSFTFIDNRSHFRLAQLRTFLENKCDAANPQAHIAMHMNKLQFFLKSARELKLFFAGILDHKLAEVSRIVDSAARNIERYQEIVQISNNNLTKAWVEAAGAINKASVRSTEALRVPTTLPSDFAWFQAVSNKKNELAREMERDARFLAFHHHERSAPKSAVGEAVLSVAAGLLLQIGTVLFVRWWKSLPKLMNRTQEDVHGKLSADIRDEVSKALQGIKFTSLDEAVLSNRLNTIYVEKLSVENESWRSAAISFFTATRELQAKFVHTRQEHLANVEELRLGALKYFTDPTRNLSILTGVAVKIKERAIEPSFELLNTTREQLLAVKNQVTTVSFD